MRFSKRPILSTLSLVALSIASLPAQDRSKPPTFQSGAELVRVDFVVTDRSDRPMKGLTAKDFIVKENGKQRSIVAFEAFAGDDATSSPTASGNPVPSARSSADAATVLLVDDGHLSPAQAARLRLALKHLLTTLGEPSGRLMLVAPGSRISVVAERPMSAAALVASVDRIVGQRNTEEPNFPVSDNEALAIARRDNPTIARVTSRFVAFNPELTREQAEMFAIERGTQLAHDARVRREATYDAARLCLDWLANRSGRRSLIIVSEGFPADPDDSKYDEIITRSLRVNAPIDFVDARGLSGFSPYHDVQYSSLLSRGQDEGPFGRWDDTAGTTGLADDTGGITISNTNDLEKGLRHVLDMMTSYYVLAYEPGTHEKPGFRKITVEVRKRGLHVRARRGYFKDALAVPSVIAPTTTHGSTVPPTSPTGASPTATQPATLNRSSALSGGQSGVIAGVLMAASTYVEGFQRAFTGIVMEESYAQDFSSASGSRTGQYTFVAHRELKSDLLLIRPGNGARDVEFRDVFEVDGHAVRDRQERLTRLFLDPSKSATDRIRAIIADSARYNIGSIERTLNTPTLPLLFLLPISQSKSTFTLTSDWSAQLDFSSPSTASIGSSIDVVLAFEEHPPNTVIRGVRGKDLPARGRFWIDPTTGRVLMTELVAEDTLVRAVVDVTYRFDVDLGVLVPADMRERYEGLRNGALVEGRATYSHFRRFEVKVDTAIKPVK
jgi:VWFA-related protein